MRNFETIYDSYTKDYHLWISNTFGQIEKSFEEKRLKYVSDLNGILAGVQASILAAPIAAMLYVDKYDIEKPLKNFLLAGGVAAVGLIATRLLQNQEATLDATRDAINTTKRDFETKSPRHFQELKGRLSSVDSQEIRIRQLLGYIRASIWLIIAFGTVGWIISWHQKKFG